MSGFGTLPTQIRLVLRDAQFTCVSVGGKAALERRRSPRVDPAEVLMTVLTLSCQRPPKTTSRAVVSPFTSKCLSSLKVNKLCSVE